MHDVTELVEVGLHLVVLQQGRPALPGLGEVGHHGGHGQPALPVGSHAAGLEPEARGVPVLPFSGKGGLFLVFGRSTDFKRGCGQVYAILERRLGLIC